MILKTKSQNSRHDEGSKTEVIFQIKFKNILRHCSTFVRRLLENRS